MTTRGSRDRATLTECGRGSPASFDVVKCELCGRGFQFLNSHLRFRHNLTVSEYKVRFPNAPIATNEFWEKHRSKVNSAFGRHSVIANVSIAQRRRFQRKEERRKASEGPKQAWLSMSEWERQDHLVKSIHSEENKRKQWASEEIQSRRSRNISNGLKRYHAGKTDEQKARFSRKMFERGRKGMIACRRKPTKPELAVRTFLNEVFPDEWKYVGDGGVWIGNRCPDFINVNGRKAVVEVFGTYWHGERARTPDDEADRKSHYRKYGFDCIVIWENECYDRDALAKVFS